MGTLINTFNCNKQNLPVSGVSGSVEIANYFYPADYWNWNMQAEAFELPTNASYPFVDVQPGTKKLYFTASGVQTKDFNPFIATYGLANLNKNVFVKVYIESTLFAQCTSMLITKWDYTDIADGMCRWQVEGRGDWRFGNFNGLAF